MKQQQKNVESHQEKIRVILEESEIDHNEVSVNGTTTSFELIGLDILLHFDDNGSLESISNE